MSDPNQSEQTLAELKEAYLDYFSQVDEDNIGGRGRIRHVTACLQLVKEGKLVRTESGGFRLPPA